MRRTEPILRPSTIILLALVSAMFVWSCFAERGAMARDWWCLNLLGEAERLLLSESGDVGVTVCGLPFAFFVDRAWGGWPRINHLLWPPLVLDFVCWSAAMLLVVRAWRWWLASDGGQARLRFHLSTAIVLMFVASLLLWLNIAPSYDRSAEIVEYGMPSPQPPVVPTAARPRYEHFHYYGWPLQFWETGEALNSMGKAVLTTDGRTYGTWFGETRNAVVNLVYDAIAGLAIVLLTGVACEGWITKRATIRKDTVTQ